MDALNSSITEIKTDVSQIKTKMQELKHSVQDTRGSGNDIEIKRSYLVSLDNLVLGPLLANGQ